PLAGKSRATPSSGSESSRIGAPLTPPRSAHTAVPFVGELTETGPGDAPRITRVEAQTSCGSLVPADERSNEGACRILRAGRERGDARPCTAVVLAPVAVPAAPHLVDAPLRDPRAELRLVVHDRHRREVVHFPARLSKPHLQVDLLGVEEEVLVEETDLVQRLASQDERGAHHTVGRARLAAA